MSLVSSRNVLLNTVFPAELIPMRAALVASVSMPAGLMIIYVADLFLGKFTFHNLLVPLVMILQVMFVIGVVWVFSLAALIFRDIQHLLNYSLTMLMVITPIAYTPAMVPDGIKGVIYFNPLAYYVMSIQYLVVLDRFPETRVIVPMVIISFLMFSLGFMLVRRAKSAFYDYA
jgi:lipopolysaccharide transport system permease protein